MRIRRTTVALTVVLVCATGGLMAAKLGHGSPAVLVAGRSNFVLLNNRKPVQLPMRVLDAAGHELDASAVHYQWLSGVPTPLSPTGVVTCTQRGDLTVRASLGAISTRVFVRCEPLRDVWGGGAINLLVDDSAYSLRFVGIGLDGRPVHNFAGVLEVHDSTVATLAGMRVRPVSPGQTGVELRVGDTGGWAWVTVYEPVRSLEGLRPDQRAVAAEVRLAPRESVTWRLPLGLFGLDWLPKVHGQPAPVMRVDGAIMCMPALGAGVESTQCLGRQPGAWITLENPVTATTVIVGHLALSRGRRRT